MKKELEKSLKRFLKKKITFTTALLVVFMISGEVTWSIDTGTGNGLAIGESSNASRGQSIALGKLANAKGDQSIAIGAVTSVNNGPTIAEGDQSIAIGGNVKSGGNSSISIGGDDLDDVAGAGRTTNDRGELEGTKIAWNQYGEDFNDDKFNTSKIAKSYKKLTGQYLVDNASSETRYIPTNSKGEGTVAIGVQSQTDGELSTAIGTKSYTNGFGATAIGVGSKGVLDNSVALGAGSYTSIAAYTKRGADGSLVYKETKVGAIEKVNGIDTVVFKKLSKDEAKKFDEKYNYAKYTGKASVGQYDDKGNLIPGTEFTYSGFKGGTKHMGKGDVVSVGGKDFERQIKHVAAGQITKDSTDAINGSQLFSIASQLQKEVVKKSVETVSAGSGVTVTPSGTENKDYKIAVAVDEKTTQIIGTDKTGNKIVKVGDKFFTVDNGGKPTTTVVAADQIAKTAVSAKTGDLTVNADTTKADAGKVVAGDEDALATAGDIANAVNNAGWILQEKGFDKDLVTAGNKVNLVDGAGTKVSVTSKNGVNEIKYGVNIDEKTIKVGKDGKLFADVKQIADTNTQNTSSAGENINITETTKADGTKNYEIATKSNVKFDNVNIDKGLTVSPKANVDMGGNQIHNVAAGTAPTDVANISQLEGIKGELGDKINDLGATSSAMAGLEFLEIGINQATVGAAVGTYGGSSAVAVGVQTAPTVNTRVHAKVAVSPKRGHRKTMASMGASWRFNWK